jgi:hypothetical protein
VTGVQVLRASCDFAGCVFVASARTVAEVQEAYKAHVRACHGDEVRVAARGTEADAAALTSESLKRARSVLKRLQ